MCCGSPLWLVDSVVMVWRRGVVRYGGFVCGVCCQIRVIGCEMWCFWGRGSCGHLGCVGGLGGGEGSGCGLRYVEDVRKSVCFGIKFSSGDALAVVRTGCSGCLEGESGLWVSGGRAGGVYGYGVVDVVAFSGCVGSCSLARSALKGGHLDMSLRAGVGKGMSLEGGEGCGGNWIRGYDWGFVLAARLYGVEVDGGGMGKERSGVYFSSLPFTGNFMPRKPDLMFMDKIVESENMDITTVVTPSNVKKIVFRPPVIEDWNSDDDSEVEFIPNVQDKTVSPITKKIKFVKSARETVEKKEYKEKGVIDSGCSRNMTGNKFYLTECEDYDGGFVSFGDGKGRISGKGKIKTGTLDFENIYFYKELKYNLFSVSPICDKKNNVLFTDTECLILSFDFKLLDESQVLLRVLRKDNIYSVDLKSVVPTKGLTCLFAKATIDESKLWHRKLASLLRPQRSLKMTILVLLVRKESNTKPPVFFLATKDETSGILKTFITEIENQLDHKVKVIRCDNGTEFKNSVMNQLCEMKGIKREFSVARTPQQNGVAERRNRTLIEAERTMLVESKLPTTFWAEAINTACYAK
ncbi:putative ribonuclease H-like domain-containing protein [Tanacetum coccineum]